MYGAYDAHVHVAMCMCLSDTVRTLPLLVPHACSLSFTCMFAHSHLNLFTQSAVLTSTWEREQEGALKIGALCVECESVGDRPGFSSPCCSVFMSL
jgi:hypothetical protein